MYSVEVCAGAGGQALGLERAGFEHVDLVEIDPWACKTLRENRKHWKVTERDLKDFPAYKYKGIDLYAGGLPCPPFSIAGKQLGESDERNLFTVAIEQIAQCNPKAVMIENVRGLRDPAFAGYREWIEASLKKQKFERVEWQLLNACEFGVPQQRPRLILIALKKNYASNFSWPVGNQSRLTVGDTLIDLMASGGWSGAESWRQKANGIAPAIVGGSKKHGGPDLGPTRARKAWAALGVNGLGIADEVPGVDFPQEASPKLTVRMVARIQGFPDEWTFVGRKTNAYRQVGNAFPPPLATAVASQIATALGAGSRKSSNRDSKKAA
jgi:DNA (cytosine-5)-methyltransferase 1